MEEITVIIGFRWFQNFRFINWLAACKAEHFRTFLARFANDPTQVLDIHVERGLVTGKCSSVNQNRKITYEYSEKVTLGSGN